MKMDAYQKLMKFQDRKIKGEDARCKFATKDLPHFSVVLMQF